jgi:UDP:flavonoid glycosyltransferase YjiC (YdhE family)
VTRKRIELLAPPFAGHLHPILGMGRALRTDHDVCVLTTPAGEASVRAAGLECVTLLKGWDEVLAAVANTPTPVKANPLRMLRQLSAALGAHHQLRTELVARYSHSQPDLLIADFTLIAAGPVAQAHGIPWWTSLPSPCVLEGGDGPPCYMGGLTPKASWAGRLRDRAGWGLIRAFKRMVSVVYRRDLRRLGIDSLYRADGSEAIYSNERILAIGWKELEFRQNWPVHVTFVPPFLYTPPSSVPEPTFVPGASHILVTLGTHLQWAKEPVLAEARAIAEANPKWQIHFSDGNINGVYSNRQANFQRLSFVDYAAHIKNYDLIVHHGGAGIMHHCLAAGIPAIVYPRDYDQFDNAARLHYAGLARRVNDLDRLGSLIRESLTDIVLKSRCGAFAARNHALAPNAHPVFESLLQ